MAVKGRGRGSAGALRERRMTIAERVVKNGSASVDELVELTGVSAMTVYRDIEALEDAGVLVRHRGQVTAVATGYGSIDLIIPGVHKANGLRILQQRWGIEDHEVVAFGDSGNDIEMLQHAGFGFAMANAAAPVKAVAGYRAPLNNEEGVLHIIDKVLNREAPFA